MKHTTGGDHPETQGSHDEVYTDGSKVERVGAAAFINSHFQDGETTCRQLSKRLPDNSIIFAAEATAITLALNYCRHMGPVLNDSILLVNYILQVCIIFGSIVILST